MEETPIDLNAVYDAIVHFKPDVVKIATHARSSLDSFRMFTVAKRANSEQQSIVALCMGQRGQITRTFSPMIENHFTFASLNQKTQTVSHQIPAESLLQTYRLRSLTPKSARYALIGNPVSHSIGHHFHNACFEERVIDAVYEKIQLEPDELGAFFQSLQTFPFAGLSVTMPLKEEIFRYMHEVDPKAQAIGAINTVVFKNGRAIGYNTDGVGALDAIEEKRVVSGQRLVVVGAGGSAKAIVYESVQRGAEVTVVNRDGEKAERLARRYQCAWAPLEQLSAVLKNGYDILVHSTSVGMTPNDEQTVVKKTELHKQAVVMDVVSSPLHTRLLQDAKEVGAQTINGKEMFYRQAQAQQVLFNLDL
jgi:3-dehydroquinate dehydratase/shikimate dehydrogenase